MPDTFPGRAALFAFLLTLLLPVLLGWGVGRVVGRGAVRARVPVGGLVLGVALAAALAPPAVARFQVYDLVLAWLLFAAGLVVSASLPVGLTAHRLALSAVFLLLGLTVLEIVAGFLPSPAVALPPSQSLSVFREGVADGRCGAALGPGLPPQPAGTRTRVLHLGDSMVHPEDVPADATFLARLRVAQPTVDHVDLGIPGTGPDAYLVQVRRRLDQVNASLAVVYVFLGNDFFDVDRRYTCCGSRTLVGDASEGFPLLCPTPYEDVPLLERLRTERPPTALLLLARHSAAAERLSAALVRGVAPWRVEDWDPTPAQVERVVGLVGATAKELQARGIASRIVLLPPRWSLEAPRQPDPFLPARDRLLGAFRDAGLEVHDAWPLLAESLAAAPSLAWFHPSPGNPHLGVDGHALVARWLQAQVLP